MLLKARTPHLMFFCSIPKLQSFPLNAFSSYLLCLGCAHFAVSCANSWHHDYLSHSNTMEVWKPGVCSFWWNLAVFHRAGFHTSIVILWEKQSRHTRICTLTSKMSTPLLCEKQPKLTKTSTSLNKPRTKFEVNFK